MTITSLIGANPKIAIIVISFLATLFITIISYFLTDKELMRRIKQKQKVLREEMKKYRDNPEKMLEINKQMMEDFPHQMKQSLKITVVTLVPMLLLFGWLRRVFVTTTISSSWIWWYILASLVFSIILRKILKMD